MPGALRPDAAFRTGSGHERQVLLQKIPGMARWMVVERPEEAPPEALVERPRLKTGRVEVRLRAAAPSRLALRGLQQRRAQARATMRVGNPERRPVVPNAQRLLQRVDSAVRVPAVEVLISTNIIQAYIIEADKTSFIADVIAKSRVQYQMQTMDQHLTELFKAGTISLETAISAATNASDFQRALDFD